MPKFLSNMFYRQRQFSEFISGNEMIQDQNINLKSWTILTIAATGKYTG